MLALMGTREDAARKAASAAARAAFIAKGVTRKDFADSIGVNVDTLSDFLNGNQLPRDENQGKIEGGLELPYGSIQQTYDAVMAGGLLSDPAPIVRSADTVGAVSGTPMVEVHVAALGVDIRSTYTDAEDRARILREILHLITTNDADGHADASLLAQTPPIEGRQNDPRISEGGDNPSD